MVIFQNQEQKMKKVENASDDIDLDYLFYVATNPQILGYSEEQFYSCSLKHLFKQIDIHMNINKGSSGTSDNKTENNNEDRNVTTYYVVD